ncbi:uncharacterized protein LTR77_011123 [Saxophila tyrrhenica]|uniref:Phosphatidic acid phosphatase type 2/haloperoxidase domain-containing protein n=1 Tax=Saxophila tyrrhenica TaxID=1690608 RepID=A0AAV9NX98_9PEZI|nr:hypothetical protein LTR77_011123 [Saxophila tyrrhenica]
MATAQREDVRHGRKARMSPSNDTGLLETLQRFWHKSYAGDYTAFILLVVLEVLLKVFDEPFHQLFRLDDPRIQYPHAEVERVPVFWLFFYAGGLPLIIVVVWTLIWRRDVHKAHVSILGLATSVLLTSFLTDVIKDAVGRPRPDLIARCSPDISTPKNELVGVEVCTETIHHVLHDGWRSFPSGHSSFSFAGLGYLSLFFASQTHLMHPRTSLLTVLLCIAPLLGAALIAISRLEDYRHDKEDVTVGAILGLLVAYFTWRRYYPGLLDKHSDEPYSMPTKSGIAGPNDGFQRVRDEEEAYGIDEDGPAGYGARDGPR